MMPSPSTYPLSPVPERRCTPDRRSAGHQQERRRRTRRSGVRHVRVRRARRGVVAAAGGERVATVGDRDQVTGRLGVADADQPVAVEGERGQAAQRALPLARVVQEARSSSVQPGHPDRQLVGDDHRLVARGRVAGVEHRGQHPRRRSRCRARPTTGGTGSTGAARSAAGAAASRRWPKRLPSKTLPDSITRSSSATVRPRAAASGAAVSWARSSGEETQVGDVAVADAARPPGRPSAGRRSERW